MKILRKDGTVIGEFESVSDAVRHGANLSEANLSEANLGWANLSEANLRWADLRWADLRGTDLSWADLSWADLSGADLCEADLRWANLRRADLREVRWNNATLTNTVGAPWHFGLGRHVAIVHEGQISIGCMTEPIEWWLAHYEAVGKTQGYPEAEIAEYGAWIQFVADRLKLRGGTD